MKKIFTALLLLTTLVTNAQIDNLLYASYDFSNNLNDANGTWNGTQTGNPVYVADRFGTASKAIKLDGVDDKLVFGKIPLQGNFSISMWLNAPVNGSNNVFQSLLSKREACTVGNFIDVRGLATPDATNSVNLEAMNGTNATGSGSGALITKGEWVHVVYILDSLSRKTVIYIDGGKYSEKSWDPLFKTVINNASLGIGTTPCSSVPFNGMVDDLKIYKGVLNNTEVRSLYTENNFCKANGGTLSLSNNRILNTSPAGTFVGKITRTKDIDEWLFPANQNDNNSYTLRNDSVFTKTVTGDTTMLFFQLNNACDPKIYEPVIIRGGNEIFLISSYSFSGNLNDSSGNGYNGVYKVNNATTTPTYQADRKGVAGSSVALNGFSDKYELGDQNWDHADITIAFWMKPTSRTKSAVVFSKREVCTVSNFIDVRYNTDGTLGAEIRNGNELAHVSSTANTTLALDTWHHVTIVMDSAKSESLMYINGLLVNKMAWTSGFSSLSNNAKVTLGYTPCLTNGTVIPFAGGIDDINVYSKALSATDIRDLYNSEVISNISEPNSPAGINIFPNPASELIYINEACEIYDRLGNKVAEGVHKIDVSHLSAGLYLVKTKSAAGKIVIE